MKVIEIKIKIMQVIVIIIIATMKTKKAILKVII